MPKEFNEVGKCWFTLEFVMVLYNGSEQNVLDSLTATTKFCFITAMDRTGIGTVPVSVAFSFNRLRKNQVEFAFTTAFFYVLIYFHTILVLSRFFESGTDTTRVSLK